MQEEVTGKSVALIISSAKMTEQVLDRAIRAYSVCGSSPSSWG